jgi:hypothetical protein
MQRTLPANAHTAVDIAVVSHPPNAMTPRAGAHTSVHASGKLLLSFMSMKTVLAVGYLFYNTCILVDNAGLPSRSRKRKLTSDIWDDFTAIYDDETGALVQGQCIHCEAIFPTSKKTGSSQCRRHRLACPEKAKLDELIGSMQPGDARIPPVKRFKFDREKACFELVRMIVLHELPFRIVEYEGFRRFVASLNPAFKLWSRTTIRDDCMAEFEKQKLELLEVLKTLPSRVSLTADL